MKRASLHTLGCRLNASETFVIQQKLIEAGFDIVPFGEPSDLAVVNTCTVTANADAKSRNIIRSFIKKNPQAFMAVVGCYSQVGYKALAEIEGVDLIMGNQEKLNVLDYAKLGKNSEPVVIRDRFVRDDFTIQFPEEEAIEHRANLKIQDGCSFVCSFCIIPRARGMARSRQMENILEEAQMLVQAGAKELILTGVNIGTYKYQDQTVLHVIDQLAQISGLERIRISSIEPTTIPTELFTWMNDSQHPLVPYLHIPLQSGSNKILKDMKRRYDRQEFIDFIQMANESVHDLCLGTDIMVGFPGETDQDFEDSKNLFLDNPFAYSHVFSYSQRDKTPAAKSAEQVHGATIKERSAELRRLSDRQQKAFAAKHQGKVMPVLFEKEKDGYFPGYTENYIRVMVPKTSEENLCNQIHSVKLTESVADFMMGELVQS